MNGEELKRKAREGGVVYGTMLSTSRNPRWATPVGALGLDYVIIDTEHSPRGRADVSDFLAALGGAGVVPIIRIPIPASHYVTQALDAGAQGVLVPYCETVDDVTEVVAATKWRPLKGALVNKIMESGQFPSEASRKYLEDRNRNSVCIIGIESVPAVENLDAILGVEDVDAVFVGPNDLSISLGVPDQYDDPAYEEALRRIITTCREHGIPVMIHHQTVELSTRWLREGARFVLHSTDVGEMHNGYRADFTAIKAVGSELAGGGAEDIGESREVI